MAPFSNESYTTSFNYIEGVTDLATALTGSFAKISITDMKTVVGDAARVKVYRRSQSFAANIIPVGSLGTGNTIKLLNNLMIGAINSITCEVFSLCKRQSIDPNLFFETISKSGAATVSKLFNEIAPKIIENDFDGMLLHIDNNDVWVKLVGEFNAY